MVRKNILTELSVITRLFMTTFVLSCFTAGFPQEIKFEVKVVSEIITPDNSIQRFLTKSVGKTKIGYLLQKNDSLVIRVDEKTTVKLPYRLSPIISYDGNTIIQYGDRTLLDEPQKLDIYWIDKEGKEKKQLVNYYGGESRINLGYDGFLSVGGPLYKKEKTESISCYSPDGDRLWEKEIDQNRRVSQLYTANNGEYVIAVTSDSEDWLAAFQLEIFRKSGQRLASIKEIGIIQRVVILNGGGQIFFQGRDYNGLIDINSGNIIWKNPVKITLVSPYGAMLSTDKKQLFLVIINEEGKRLSPYVWKFLVLDAMSGKEIDSSILPGKYPATWDHIFESVTDTSATILAGDSLLDIVLKLQEGGHQ